MLTDEALKAIKERVEHRWDSAFSKAQFAAWIMTDVAALIAEVERLQAKVLKLQAVVAANPMMSKSVQKRLAAQTLDATSEGKGKITFPRKGYDLAGPENHHFLRPGRTS